MELKGKALFNLIKLNAKEEKNSDIRPWQIEDLRSLSIPELFARLKKVGIILDEASFSLYAENNDSPEELADCLCFDEMTEEEYDQVYLLVFELWRRLFKDKFCLSIFCDELDQLIERYDQGVMDNEEALLHAFAFLEDILDDAFDKGSPPQGLLQEVSSYCAHDLETFIVDYAADQITQGNTIYASELIDAFMPYAAHPKRFELLKASIIALSDEETADIIYRRILEDLVELHDVDLALQFAEHLVHHGRLKLFLEVAQEALKQIRTEEEFQALLLTMSEYYRCLDQDEISKKILDILHQRSPRSLKEPFGTQDKDLMATIQFLSRIP